MNPNENVNDKSDIAPLLEQPSVEEAPDGILDPDARSATVVVPVYTGKAVDDYITMHWTAETREGSTYDGLPVTQTSKSRPASFNVEAEYIKVNTGTRVKVYYTVAHRDGSNSESRIFFLNIMYNATGPKNLKPPSVDGVVNGVLNLEGVPSQGAAATVAPYNPMFLNDVVYIEINEEGGIPGKVIDKPEQIDAPISFIIPYEALQRHSGQTINLYTRLFREGTPFNSAPLPILVSEPVGTLPPVKVPLAPQHVLEPRDVTGASVEVIVEPYQGIAEGDEIEFTWKNADSIQLPYREKQTVGPVPIQDYFFFVPRAQVDENIDGRATLSYTVKRGIASPKPSEPLTLWIGESFEMPAELDLTKFRYILAEQLPPKMPAAFCYTREAHFGQGPYTYKSSDPKIATVDGAGKVVAINNGTVNITATDNKNLSFSYPLTVRGVHKLYFVSAAVDFAGAGRACATEGLRIPLVEDMRQFWQLYTAGDAGPVADYLGWLPYLFWTGTEKGADTAFAYDLNGNAAQDNVTGFTKETYLQVAGIHP
ncbi:Ig-like domain-containing protein [Brucella intermedia]|uniref:Ig-like domain-containing protein n=1 Tax=Brucella intermedia TaxID=94625 RepID=UPI000C2816FF|nr:Ig-like domain-containing protein [Brucella intermedia]PJR92008.1 hypothetical protein CN881_10530 [Ochrobactrum sp. 721/2009]PJT15068.1 hypothetical protein CN880_17335 [Ochrobactrum sp. 720/2009]PJT18095.1 hypothetical protein CN879_23540 [Ochrobactrum sp. 715/2009]PJT23025.1 hypothetical protein CN878_23370 [Ochrobactrum sp. 695/2009]PJT32685.1 hypothetical protein CN877_20685 [Ochrobactrum sp. 689/2009]